MSTIILSLSNVQHFLLLFSCVPTIFPFLVGLLHFPRLNLQQKGMMLLSLVTFIVGLWSVGLWLNKENNLFIGHFYTVIQFHIIVIIYLLTFQSTAMKRLLIVLMITFTAFSIINTLNYQPLEKHNSNASTLGNILLIFLALTFFFKTITRPKEYRLERMYMFWFNSGVLLYFFCSLFIFAISNSLLPAKFWSASIPIWMLHNVFMWIFFILTTVAVWISPKPLK